MTEPTFADVAEGVRAAIATYTHALDDGRTSDVVATYCPDGTFEGPGIGTHTGHEALGAVYAGWVPRVPQRHLVVNTELTEWSATEARATSDVVLLVEGTDGWAVRFVARYHDHLHRDGAHWRFHTRSVG